MSLYDLLYWSNGIGKCFAKGTRVLMYDGTQMSKSLMHNVPGCPTVGKKTRLATSDYIWEIPIKDFLAASDEVQRSCLMAKPNQVIFKSEQGIFRVILSNLAASWLD
ncbi:unnamed protein product [Rhizophagus irregularis]|nr:unnamed protein product [Rhizophagus irregularis]CAB5355423.1 unnamed protein product [Rhizophagus irregularis]